MIFDIKPTPDGGITATQRQSVPAVYLDFCALRILAEKPELASRFVGAMRRLPATLLVSEFTIFEFTLVSDLRHARAVDTMLEQLFAHLYFMRCEPFTVIALENALHSSSKAIVPHADTDLFRSTLMLVAQQKGPFELTSIFSAGHVRLRPTIDEFRVNVRKSFETLKLRLETEPDLRRNATRMLATVGNRPAATLALLLSLIKPLHDDRLPSENDTIDFLHAVVPGAYAELIVLDGKWANAIVQATRKIRDAGYTAPIARAFSPRKDGINDFLAALEKWPAPRASNSVDSA